VTRDGRTVGPTRAIVLPIAAVIAIWVAAAVAIAPGRADAATDPVTVEYQSFLPGAIDALPGDTIRWSNNGGRTHTVTADDGTFDSGDLLVGKQFTWSFTAPGMYMYHCAIHRGMVGEVDVRLVTLDPVPSGAVAAGRSVHLQGRTSDPGVPVSIERDAGDGFEPATSVSPQSDGTWETDVIATSTGQYRAAVDGGFSETRRLLVVARQVRVHVTGRYVSVQVLPKAPHARVALQLHLRDRFGWWPQRRARLNSASRARFVIHHPVRARVALLGRDGWTALALSRVVRIE
jgi:plastocyanin